MKLLGLLSMMCLLLTTVTTRADSPPPKPDDWQLYYKSFCTVDGAEEVGFCELYTDDEGVLWVIFFDKPGHIQFIRTKIGDDLHYIYQALVGESA